MSAMKIVLYDKRKKWEIILITIILALLLWTYIVYYPNPYIFIRSLLRYAHFPVDPSIVGIIDEEIPNDPVEIENFVYKLVKYENDWANYGVPWYLTTPDDAVTRRKGDCESRAMVLASILSAKNIPYKLNASLVHVWVEYPTKKPSSFENGKISFVGKVDGKYKVKPPDLVQWQEYVSAEKELLWSAMPSHRKIIMVSGWAVILFSGCFMFVRLARKARPPLLSSIKKAKS